MSSRPTVLPPVLSRALASNTVIAPAKPVEVISAAEYNILKAAGFIQPTISRKPPRLSIATEGRTKNGKTHFALMTTPETVAVITMDPGTLAIIERAVWGGRKMLPIYIAHDKKEDKDTAIKLWQQFRTAIRTVMGVKGIRTLVIDTISEAWELLQMAEFGKLKQNNKFAYGGLNAEFQGLIQELYYGRPDLNTIYIQRVKKLYTKGKAKKDKETGEEVDMGGDWDGKSMEAIGFKTLDYEVDMSLVHEFRDQKFSVTTKTTEATRFGPQFSGLKFSGQECNFLDVALHIFGTNDAVPGFSNAGADPEYWASPATINKLWADK